MAAEYFNTTNATNPELKEYRDKAKTQEEIIIEAFERIGGSLSAEYIHRSTFGSSVPLTSVRRAISCLCRKGVLVMNAKQSQVMGIYGRKVNTYRMITK